MLKRKHIFVFFLWIIVSVIFLLVLLKSLIPPGIAAIFLFQTGCYDQALTLVNQSIEKNPDNVEDYRLRAQINDKLNHNEAIADEYEVIIAIEAPDDYTYSWYEFLLESICLPPSGPAETADQNDSGAWNTLRHGIRCLREQSYEEALKSLSEAVRLSENDETLPYRYFGMAILARADVYEALGDKQSADNDRMIWRRLLIERRKHASR